MAVFSREVIKVEGKSLEVGLVSSKKKGEVFCFIEKGRKTFKATSSEGGGRWTGRFLCEASAGFNRARNYHDSEASILACIKSNQNGFYIEFTFFVKHSSGRPKRICVPAGIDKGGWADVGIACLALFDPNLRDFSANDSQSFRIDAKEKISVNQNAGSIKMARPDLMKVIIEKEGISHRLVMESNTGIHNISWWKSAVICTPSWKLKSWWPILGEIQHIFGEMSLTALETGEAIAFMQTPEDAMKLSNFKPLKWGGMEINFRRWTPEFNTISTPFCKSKFVWVKLLGIPLHLKKREYVERLVKGYGTAIEIDLESLKISSAVAKVKVMDPRCEAIPRFVNLEERGYEYSIFIDIEIEQSLVTTIPDEETSMCGERAPVRAVANNGEAVSDEGSSVQRWRPMSKGQGGAPDQNPPCIDVGHVATQERVFLKSLKVDEDNTVGPQTALDLSFQIPSYADVARKGKWVPPIVDNTIAKPSIFSPLESIAEEEAQTVSEKGLVQDGFEKYQGPHYKKKKWTKFPLSHGVQSPSLVLSKRILNIQAEKKKREQTFRVVKRILQRNDYSAHSSQSSSSIDRVVDSQLEPKCGASPEFLGDNSDSPLSNNDLEMLHDTPTVSDLPPPGFEGRPISNKEDFEETQQSIPQEFHNKEQFFLWIDKFLEPVAFKLGLTSNRGENFVRHCFHAIGESKLEAENSNATDDDAREVENYKNSNLVIRDDMFSNDD
ncbi:hypothetical protein FRX31_005679 [Thalictrum thalictroides]|uniref:DUF4283 domain-containing protein n=1 Tax=Thalictrum thalictroides TaxID=46969 RepID=A0A7J6X4W8_THATH|nr:hypothetical protein FRX31_005679 [Thalictrum thalictroides]